MSQIIRRRVGVLLVALLVAGPPGYGEVTSRGFAAFQRPPIADNPPDDYIADEYEHDVATGEVFDLTDHYELRQGAEEDNKTRWKDTDWIHWKVNGATLRAWGQIQDGDHEKATIASSEAWGAEYVDATVSASEGSWGVIEAENRISFRYSYLISGPYVGEASVQLNAAAYDIKHKDHHFHLNDQSGESVESDEGHRQDTDLRVKIAGDKTLVISNKGAEGKVQSHAEMEYENGEQLDVRIGRRFHQSSGNSGSTPTVVVHEKVSGNTPLSAHYEVFSEADVTLRARAGRIPGSGASSTVVVQLGEFRVENTLRVWTRAESEPPPPGTPPDVPPVSYPESGCGPTTPGGDGGSGADGGGSEADGEAEAEPDTETATEPDGDTDGSMRRATLPLDGPDPVTACAVAVAPDGLEDEPGSRAGRLRISVNTPAPRDLRFAVTTEPPGVLEAAAPELVIAAGETLGGIYVHGVAPGRTDVSLRFLDGNGAATSAVLVVPVETVSVTSHLEPRLWASLAGRARADRRGTSVTALAGTDLGALRIGRGGFLGYSGTATGVRVEVDDPEDVLAPLPDRVEIAAGTEAVDIPLCLNDATGAATITLRGDDGQRIPVYVRSVTQAWRSVPRVRVPIGAEVHVPILLAEPGPGGRAVEAASDNEGCVLVGDVTAPLPGGRLAGVWIRAVAAGVTTLRLGSPGLPGLSVAVEAVEPVVRIEAGRLEIDAVDATTEGEIVLWLPPGVCVAALDIPAELVDHVDTRGVGTGKLLITVVPGPDLPERLAFPIRFDGQPVEPFAVDVLDTLHPAAGDVRHTIRVEVR